MTIEISVVDYAEALVDATFQDNNKNAIQRAEEIANGRGCQCRNCVFEARREANYAIQDLAPDAPYSYGTEVVNGHLRLTRNVTVKRS